MLTIFISNIGPGSPIIYFGLHIYNWVLISKKITYKGLWNYNTVAHQTGGKKYN